MTGSAFLWSVIASATVLDLVGLFYLWRRRQKGTLHRARGRNGRDPRSAIPRQERRQKERRAHPHTTTGPHALARKAASRARL